MTSTAPARGPEVPIGQLKVLAGLLPYLWPTGRGDLKARVAVAVVFLVLAKLATVTVPLVLKEAVDALTPAGAVETAAGLAIALPLAMLLAYGARKSVGEGKRVSIGVDIGGGRVIKKNKKSTNT